MQILILDYNIQENVKMYCDKHVNKLLTETCQLLSTWYRWKVGDNVPDFMYKSTHFNHPISKWMRENIDNVNYVVTIAFYLYKEYQYRYSKLDKHIRNKKIIDYFYNALIGHCYHPPKIFVQAMPEQYKQKDTVQAYRAYYNAEKLHFAKWTQRDIPSWIDKTKLQEVK